MARLKRSMERLSFPTAWDEDGEGWMPQCPISFERAPSMQFCRARDSDSNNMDGRTLVYSLIHS